MARGLGLYRPSRTGAGRSPFEQDYDRILFSNAFRRLKDKTQVFPLPANDHVHNRLTHSLEVASVGRSLGKRVGHVLIERHHELAGAGLHHSDVGDIVAAASLMHDIGNPPFGHSGEDAIGAWFRRASAGERGPALATALAELSPAEASDLAAFEGNAQAFRLVANRLMYRGRGGMQLTRAVLAAAIKYPQGSPAAGARAGVQHKKFNAFQAEMSLLQNLAESLGLAVVADGCWCRHPLAWLTEAADDCCYHVLDLEDAFFLDRFTADEVHDLLLPLCSFRDGLLPADSDPRERVAQLRGRAIASLIDQVVEAFLDAEEALLAGTVERALVDHIAAATDLERIAQVSVDRIYNAPEVVAVECAGYRVLGELLDRFVPALLLDDGMRERAKLRRLLPDWVTGEVGPYPRLLALGDWLSGMTDRYAVRLYRGLMGIDLGI